MEAIIAQLATSAGSLAAVLALIWWRTGRIEHKISDLWRAFDAHRLDRGIHPDQLDLDRLTNRVDALSDRRPR